MATLNISMRVNRAITGATTVTANACAFVTYQYSFASSTNSGADSAYSYPSVIHRTFGPGQAIPSSITTQVGDVIGNGSPKGTCSVTYNLVSGFELINTQ